MTNGDGNRSTSVLGSSATDKTAGTLQNCQFDSYVVDLKSTLTVHSNRSDDIFTQMLLVLVSPLYKVNGEYGRVIPQLPVLASVRHSPSQGR